MFFETVLADGIRYAYARSPLLAKVFEQRATVDAAIGSLGVPIVEARRARLSDDEARRALKDYIQFLSSFEAGGFYRVPPPEIAAAALVRSTLPDELRRTAFHDLPDEDSLTAPVARYLIRKGYDVFLEVDTSRKRADLIGHRSGPFGGTTVAVELKNAVADFDRGMSQITTYAGYAHHVWVGCTPALAAALLDDHTKGVAVLGWDPKWLEKKLASAGCGLLLVEAGKVTEVLEPRGNSLDSRGRAEVQRLLATRKRFVAPPQ